MFYDFVDKGHDFFEGTSTTCLQFHSFLNFRAAEHPLLVVGSKLSPSYWPVNYVS